MGIIVSGFATDNAIPGSYRASVLGAGLVSIGSMPVKVCAAGNKTSAGSATPDVDIVGPLSGEADADTQLGAGSEVATICYGAFTVGDVNVYAAPVLEPAAGPVASSIVLTWGGAATRNGTVRGRVGGKTFAFGAATTDATTVVATNCDLGCKTMVRAQVTSGAAASATTLTNRNTGARGNQLVLTLDLSEVPGLTCTVTVGALVAGHTNMWTFGSGAGADSIAPQLANLAGDVYDYLAIAANDTTTMGLVKTHLASEAMPGTSHLESAFFAICGTYSAAASLGNTTLNDARCVIAWAKYGENSPAWLVGKLAATRAAMVGQQPNYKWAGTPECVLKGAQPQIKADNPTRVEQKNALNNGVCVLRTDGTDLVIVRGITSKCLTGTSPDFNSRDWPDVDVTDRINKEVGALWTAVSAANPWNEPDSTTGAPAAPRTITPSLWNGRLLTMMRGFANDGWVYLVEEHPPQSEWSTQRGCIMSAIPAYVKPKSFQLGANINQTVAS
jgi:phage tail sheath gpL-like